MSRRPPLARFVLLSAAACAFLLACAPDDAKRARLAELDALVVAYPEFLARHDGATLFWRDGTRMRISDGREGKTWRELGEQPDIDDIFAWTYPIGASARAPPREFDPGRARPHAMFVKMYGDCRKGEVARKLVDVRWVGGTRVRFTSANGANRALERVARDLEALGPGYADYLNPIAGTYNCRVVAGTKTYSMHAFGAAIDINARHGDYWRWAGGEGARWRNRIPIEIARAFERHGFIWGGRWDRFDTFHFEYRPELIRAARIGNRE